MKYSFPTFELLDTRLDLSTQEERMRYLEKVEIAQEVLREQEERKLATKYRNVFAIRSNN